MSAAILVGYATRNGSTQEVAESVTTTLREAGVEVDIQSLLKVRSVAGYRLVVIGAPLYMFRWHRDARAFISRHQEKLKKLVVAAFAMGPFHDEEKEWQSARAQFEKELASFPSFTPVSHEVFGGKFDPAKLRFPWSWIPALKKIPESDIRDWARIREWAAALAKKV